MTLSSPTKFPASLHLCVSLLLVLIIAPEIRAADLDPIKLALLVDAMATRGSSYDAAELHTLDTAGLAAVLDYLLPDTAAAKQLPKGLPEDRVQALLHDLDANDFATREFATEELVAKARGNQAAIEQAAHGDSLEVRLRVERVLASWESKPAASLGAYLSGYWSYIEHIADPPRLKLLAERTVKALDSGMPENDRLHLIRLSIAGVAHGRDEPSCDLLRPLVRHTDVRIATFVTETVGKYKNEARFVPSLLVDALRSDRPQVVELAVCFVLGCEDPVRRSQVQAALRQLFETGPEPLKFQSCLPLLRDFQDADAWAYVIEQAGGTDNGRIRTALNWLGDTKPTSQPPAATLLAHFDRQLQSNPQVRRATAIALGKFQGEPAIRRLVNRLSDADDAVVREAEGCLLAQPDRALVKMLLIEQLREDNSLAKQNSTVFNSRIQTLLGKL